MALTTGKFDVSDLPHRQRYDDLKGIYLHKLDNRYPLVVETAILNSPTAKNCTYEFSKYVSGKGYGDALNRFIVDKKNGTTLMRFIRNAATSYAYHGGVFVHVDYTASLEVASVEVLPYRHCRVGKKDDNKYSAKILVYDNWGCEVDDDERVDEAVTFDVYNDEKKVIAEQIREAGGLKKYKGQVLFFNPSDFLYPLAPINPALKDAQSEALASTYRYNLLANGYLGKKILIGRPQASEIEDEDERKAKQQADVTKVQGDLNRFVGVENAGGFMYVEADFQGDDVSKHFHLLDATGQIDDATFEYTEKQTELNILKAFNIPSYGLVRPNESGFLSVSGEAIKQNRLIFQESTEEERGRLNDDLLVPLLSRFAGFPTPPAGMHIKPLVDEFQTPPLT